MGVEELVTYCLLGIVGAGLTGFVAQVFLSYMAQRGLQDLHSQGMQAIIAINELQVVDESMERRNRGNSQ